MSTGFESDGSSDDEIEFDNSHWPHASAAAHRRRRLELHEPYDRNQGFFLANLAKLLDECERINLSLFLRWAPERDNALQINWPGFIQSYPQIHDVLVSYKMVRKSNSVVSARSSWNRKLREWKFTMQAPRGAECWTTYTYMSSEFHRGCRYELLPNKRR